MGGGGRPNLMLAQVQGFCPGPGQDLTGTGTGPGPDLGPGMGPGPELDNIALTTGLLSTLIQEILVVYFFSCHKLKCGNMNLLLMWHVTGMSIHDRSQCSPKCNLVWVSYCLKNYTLFIGLL